MFDERIVAYKRQHGMATDDPRIAVIVQEQVPSEVSGVAFSLNPQNNCYDEAVINANFGLGETVVNGHVTPDTYVVEKVRGEILERGIASKSHAAWLVNGGGTEERDNADPEAPSLTDEQTLAVAELAADAEEPTTARRWTSSGPSTTRSCTSCSRGPSPPTSRCPRA